MLKLYGIQFTFENLFVLTCSIAAAIFLTNLIFWITLFILKRKKNNLKVKFLNRENGHKLARFKFIDTDYHIPVTKKGFFKLDGFKSLAQKRTYIIFFKSLGRKNTYRFLINPKFWIVTISILGVVFLYQSLMLMFHGHPDVVSRYPIAEVEWDDPKKPIEVVFDRPIDVNKLKFSLVPEIEGKLEYEKSFPNLPFTRKVLFYPKNSTDSGFTFYHYVSGIHALWNNEPRYDHETYFLSYRNPEIVNSNVKDKDEDILVNQEFTFELNKDYDEFTDFEFEFSPILEFDKTIEGNKIILKPKNTLGQSATYKLSVFKISKTLNLETKEVLSQSEKSLLQEINFTTVKAPEIKSFAPTGNSVFVDSEIKIEFSKEMFPDTVISKLSVNPSFEYTPEWSVNNSVLILKRSGNLEYGKEYEIKLAAGSQGKGNTILEKDFSYKFTTIGEVKVLAVSPGNGAGGVNIASSISVTFDQEVDRNSAQSKFSISPNVGVSYAWNGSVVTIKPSGSLAYGTKYTYSFAAGIKSAKGKDSTKTFSYSFTTRAQTITLNVPHYRQPYSFACNVTAARMVLAYKGISRSVDQIYASIPHSSPTNKEGNTWGDPDAGFVGPITSGGYGVHWGPISSYLSGQGVSNQVRRGMSVSQLAKEIEAGRPAIVWWWNQINKAADGGPISQSWTTPGGKNVNTIVGMHSEVVIGFNGSSDNPTSFIVNDPRGSTRTIPVGTFKYLWGIFGNTAVVVN